MVASLDNNGGGGGGGDGIDNGDGIDKGDDNSDVIDVSGKRMESVTEETFVVWFEKIKDEGLVNLLRFGRLCRRCFDVYEENIIVGCTLVFGGCSFI